MCEISATLNAAPAGGANAYSRSTRAPATYTGTGAPGMFDVTKSQHLSMPPNNAVVVAVGSRLRTPAIVLVIWSAGSARQPRMSVRSAAMRSRGSSIDVGTGKRAGAKRFPPASSSL